MVSTFSWGHQKCFTFSIKCQRNLTGYTRNLTQMIHAYSGSLRQRRVIYIPIKRVNRGLWWWRTWRVISFFWSGASETGLGGGGSLFSLQQTHSFKCIELSNSVRLCRGLDASMPLCEVRGNVWKGVREIQSKTRSARWRVWSVFSPYNLSS